MLAKMSLILDSCTPLDRLSNQSNSVTYIVLNKIWASYYSKRTMGWAVWH